MNCYFCKSPCNMTARDSDLTLYNICERCMDLHRKHYDEEEGKYIGPEEKPELTISCAWKANEGGF